LAFLQIEASGGLIGFVHFLLHLMDNLFLIAYFSRGLRLELLEFLLLVLTQLSAFLTNVLYNSMQSINFQARQQKPGQELRLIDFGLFLGLLR